MSFISVPKTFRWAVGRPGILPASYQEIVPAEISAGHAMQAFFAKHSLEAGVRLA